MTNSASFLPFSHRLKAFRLWFGAGLFHRNISGISKTKSSLLQRPWAMVAIVIGMKPESGASILGYLARIDGAAVAVILSLFVWCSCGASLVDMQLESWFSSKSQMSSKSVPLRCLFDAADHFLLLVSFMGSLPQYLASCRITIVTLNIIVAYELQVITPM